MFQNISESNKTRIYWIASYPRSGNTFTRILLSNYLIQKNETHPLNELYNFIPSDTMEGLWEKLLPGPWQESEPEQKWRWRSSLVRAYRELRDQRPFPALKTHTANLSIFDREAFDFQPHDKAIYLVRHPLDLALSYADYNGRDLNKAVEIMSTSGVYMDGDTLGAFELRGSWTEHVASWLTCKNCPVLLVRYEDLCDRTETVFRDMLTFLEIPIDDERLRRAVQLSTFKSLQQQEEKEGFQERPATALSGRFFREGRSRQWLQAMSPEQAYRLADHCSEVMTKLGYTHPRDVYFDGRNAYGPVKL